LIMWSCPKCGNENEENFRFCWGCGITRPEIKAKPEIKTPVEEPKIETPKPPEPIKREIVRNNPEPEEFRKIADDDEDVLPMLAHFSGTEHTPSQSDNEISLERKIFTIAVRLVGLFLLYQVLIGIPDLAVMIYSILSSDKSDAAENLFTSAFIIPTIKLLFYLIVGIYLIASGRVLLWLLPR
jgi:hypothetical protein